VGGNGGRAEDWTNIIELHKTITEMRTEKSGEEVTEKRALFGLKGKN